MNHTLIQQISSSLLSDNSAENRTSWMHFLIDKEIDLTEVIDLLFEKSPAATRFSWMLGELCWNQPEKLITVSSHIFNKRKEVEVVNFERSVAKIFTYIDIPKEIEGEAVDALFNWLIDPTKNVSTKTYAMEALLRATKKFPGLKLELIACIKDQLDKTSISFKTRATKILKKLEA